MTSFGKVLVQGQTPTGCSCSTQPFKIRTMVNAGAKYQNKDIVSVRCSIWRGKSTATEVENFHEARDDVGMASFTDRREMILRLHQTRTEAYAH